MSSPRWKDPSKLIQQLYVSESCMDYSDTQAIIERANLPVILVPEGEKPNELDKAFSKNLFAGKKQLFLTENKGSFFKPCPATKEYRCCDYYVLNIGTNCPMDCVYCILQAYLNSPWLIFYVNTDKLFEELHRVLRRDQHNFYRIGTGEFTDSMALDRLTRLSERLVECVAVYENVVLELKTKSAYIESLEGLDHNGKTVVSWSLNGRSILRTEEIGAASLEQRLWAARTCADWGYKLAFHFDPIIEYPNWAEEYEEVIDKLYDTVPASSIAWISLGALRFIPKLKEIGYERFPHSKIYHNEFILGLDGKARYFRPKRVTLYKKLYDLLSSRADERTCIYFCMESDEIWQEVCGYCPADKGGLPTMLDRAARIP